MYFPIILLGLVFSSQTLLNVGILLFGTIALFQLVTLPVEFNASRRALAFIESSDLISRDEYVGAKKMLTAAAMTYVAALAQSMLQLLFYIIRFTGNGRRK